MIDLQQNEKKETRKGFGDAMYELGQVREDVVVLTADLGGSLRLNDFIKHFPDRFFNAGVAEANMVGVAAGMTIGGRIPFATSFANFLTGRVYDQIRQSVAYANKNVKLCASHAGLTLGEDGATHQILEDIGLMRMLPNMTVIVPADYNQTKAATKAIVDHEGPVYLRFGRPKVPNFMPEEESFTIGKATVLQEGTDVTVIACGHMVYKSIEAAQQLAAKNISVEVINMATIKPLDESAILRSVEKTGCVVTAEEHQLHGGLGDAVAHVLTSHHPAPQEIVAVQDTFGESGTPDQLMAKYGIDTANVVAAIEKVLVRK